MIRVLAIDYTPEVLRILEHLFGKRAPDGMFVLTTHRSFEAALATPSPDVILLDLNLGDINGVATYQKAAELWPGTPIIIITASAPSSDEARLITLGAEDYLYKPEVLRADGFPRVLRAIDRALASRGRVGESVTIRRHAVNLDNGHAKKTAVKWLALLAPSATLLGLALSTGFCTKPWDTQSAAQAATTYEKKVEADKVHTELATEQREHRKILLDMREMLGRLMERQGLRRKPVADVP